MERNLLRREILNLSGITPDQRENESWWSQLWAPINLDKLVPKMISPVHHPVISSEFGPRKRPKSGGSTYHKGIDIVDADQNKTLGKDVVAPANGIITRIVKDMDPITGNFIEIKDTEGYLHKFMHLNYRNLGNGFSKGHKVSMGEKIAEIGGSGIAKDDGYHLHYEIIKNSQSLNPRTVNPGLKNALTKIEARLGKSSGSASKNTIPANPAKHQLDTDKSYRDNHHFAQILGWKKHLNQIISLISMPFIFKNLDVLSRNNQPFFAHYVAAWQQKNGFAGKDVDGVIGPKTWEKMKMAFNKQIPLPVPTSAGAGRSAAFNIDVSFIHKLENASGSLKASVPNPDGSQSGVTVADGLDLGQINSEQGLLALKLNPALIKKLKPYLGVKKHKAVELLKRQPLSITPEEALEINTKVIAYKLPQLAQQYARKSKVPFTDLPRAAQTVIYSVFHQYGSLNRTPKFFEYVASQDWRNAIKELRNFGDDYPRRRNTEADYLEKML